ncbi:MAG: hypothetical protein AB1798_23375 [Spirochaetota bacterium]
MKCGKCGADLNGNKICRNCGAIAPAHEEEFEIEYKDFKTSELLEIRQKRRKAGGARESKPVIEEDIKQSRGHTSFSADTVLKRDKKNTAYGRYVIRRTRNQFIFVLIVIFVIAVIGGAFFILRPLINR